MKFVLKCLVAAFRSLCWEMNGIGFYLQSLVWMDAYSDKASESQLQYLGASSNRYCHHFGPEVKDRMWLLVSEWRSFWGGCHLSGAITFHGENFPVCGEVSTEIKIWALLLQPQSVLPISCTNQKPEGKGAHWCEPWRTTSEGRAGGNECRVGFTGCVEGI
jgi:hypothetical protein